MGTKIGFKKCNKIVRGEIKKKLIKISIKHIKKTIKSKRTKLNTKINLNKFYRDEIENKIKFKRHHKQNKE